MKKCAVIIAAYNAERFIASCHRSISSQSVPGWEIEIRIGVDGCEKTASVLRNLKIPFYWSEKNHGAYLIRNSLIYLDRADAYSYFDADDVMLPGYMIETLEKIEQSADAVLCGKYQCDANMQKIKETPIIESGGAMSFTNSVLDAVGGYYRWRCAGDTDFMERLKMAGYKITEIKNGLYKRRRHPGSLTKGGVTKFGGEYRRNAWADMCEKRSQGIIKIQPTTVELISVP